MSDLNAILDLIDGASEDLTISEWAMRWREPTAVQISVEHQQSKTARAAAITPHIEAGTVWLPPPGQPEIGDQQRNGRLPRRNRPHTTR